MDQEPDHAMVEAQARLDERLSYGSPLAEVEKVIIDPLPSAKSRGPPCGSMPRRRCPCTWPKPWAKPLGGQASRLGRLRTPPCGQQGV